MLRIGLNVHFRPFNAKTPIRGYFPSLTIGSECIESTPRKETIKADVHVAFSSTRYENRIDQAFKKAISKLARST
jgi:hypothetical protein